MRKRIAFLLLGIFAACTVPPVVDDTVQSSKVDAIESIVSASACTKYRWKDRGVLPIGYFKGMAKSYHKSLCALKKGDAGVMAMAAPVPAANRDALDHYAIPNGSAEANLKNLYALTIGLGARESSGKYCVGRDITNPKPSSTGAEAGLFQTSYNIIESVKLQSRSSAQIMTQLFTDYQNNSLGCDLETFSEGVDYAKKCAGHNASTYGEGVGATYQKLAKSCPVFHTEFSLIGLRYARHHWGPINRKEAELRSECVQMLTEVAALGCGG